MINPNFLYKGTVYYVTQLSKKDIMFLSQFIPTLNIQYEPELNFKRPSHNQVIQSQTYNELFYTTEMFSRNPTKYPFNTPDQYRQAFVSKENIKNHTLFKIYIPALSKSNMHLNKTPLLLNYILISLMYEDILQIQTHTVTQNHNYDYNQGQTDIIKSTHDSIDDIYNQIESKIKNKGVV